MAIQIAKGTTLATVATDDKYPSLWAYVAGPMRGYPDFNFPAFDRQRDVLRYKGYIVISPADIDRAANDTHWGEELPDQSVYVFRDFWALYFLATCKKGRCYISMLPGWEASRGATAEKALAEWLGIEVL